MPETWWLVLILYLRDRSREAGFVCARRATLPRAGLRRVCPALGRGGPSARGRTLRHRKPRRGLARAGRHRKLERGDGATILVLGLSGGAEAAGLRKRARLYPGAKPLRGVPVQHALRVFRAGRAERARGFLPEGGGGAPARHRGDALG